MLNGVVSSVLGQRKDNTTISVALTIEIYNLKITKKGNKNLRCLLYLAIQNTLKQENKISEFYNKKIAAGMNPKAAKVACMNKLVRIIYSMCKNGSLFE